MNYLIAAVILQWAAIVWAFFQIGRLIVDMRDLEGTVDALMQHNLTMETRIQQLENPNGQQETSNG